MKVCDTDPCKTQHRRNGDTADTGPGHKARDTDCDKHARDGFIHNTADTFFTSPGLNECQRSCRHRLFNNGDIPQNWTAFGTGAASMISRKLGAHETDSASTYASTSFFLAFGTGLFFTVFGLLYLDDFMIRLSSTVLHPSLCKKLCKVHPSRSTDNGHLFCHEQHPQG